MDGWAAAVVVGIAVGLMCAATVGAAQEKAITNPVAGDAAAVKEGASLFRGNCSPCHGVNARGGGRGPDLTSGRWTHGETDGDIFRTISDGVPGTEMPANGFEDSEIWSIVAYLRSLAPAKRAVTGDAKKGETIFWDQAGCGSCHMVRGRGGRLGPDLSRVGAARSAEYLEESVREPSKELSDGLVDPNNHYGNPLVYDTVTVVMKSGETVRGVAKNEDTFSIQMMDMGQQLRVFSKKDLKDVKHERVSLMPAYPEEQLSAEQLRDVVGYLEGLE
jgi:putative heme-binding domain-containing protein